MKVAIIGNHTSELIRSRGELIKAMIAKGHTVVAIGNEDVDQKKIEALGAKPVNVDVDRISASIWKNGKYIVELKKVLQQEQIDVVLGYSAKPIICGTIAAKMAKVPHIFALVVGMGYSYSVDTLRVRIIRFFTNIGYRIAGKWVQKMIFQNKEDQEELIRRKFVKAEKTAVVDGSGVNLEDFPQTENKISSNKQMKFLMIARGINVKGIKELSIAARAVKEKYPEVQFIHIGGMEQSFRGISEQEKQEYAKVITFEGKVNDVYAYLKEANVVVLPSYLREGIPRVLLEALAVGRPIITTNMRGCKETVIEGKNGFLVQPRDAKDLEEKIMQMLELPIEKLQEMSAFSHYLASKRFDVKKINPKMLQLMGL